MLTIVGTCFGAALSWPGMYERVSHTRESKIISYSSHTLLLSYATCMRGYLIFERVFHALHIRFSYEEEDACHMPCQ